MKSKLPPNELMRRRQDEIRGQIRATKLVQRLEAHADGKCNPPMTSTQVQAAMVLLRKVLPDLQSIDQTVSGDDSRPIKITISNA